MRKQTGKDRRSLGGKAKKVGEGKGVASTIKSTCSIA
jgi:hypothetical protein